MEYAAEVWWTAGGHSACKSTLRWHKLAKKGAWVERFKVYAWLGSCEAAVLTEDCLSCVGG